MIILAAATHILKADPPQVVYQVPQKRSDIPVPTPTIVPDPDGFTRSDQGFEFGAPRSYAYADFNNDGLIDVFVAPAFGHNLPRSPIEIWLNKGGGTFFNGTSQVIDGTPPLTWNASDIFIGDFNGDGRADALIIASGSEFAVQNHYPDQGDHLTLLLSQLNGKLKDATSQIGDNPYIFHSRGGIGDFDGDGHLDLVVNPGHTDSIQSQGIALYKGDGKGNFVKTVAGLPQDIVYWPIAERAANDYQITGTATLVDLDGDGRADLVTGSYSAPDPQAHTRTIRFYQSKADGTFVERNRVEIPSAIAGVGFSTPNFSSEGFGLAATHIEVGDINGDGRPDLVVTYEGYRQYAVIWRNDGNFRFTDVTVDARGTYNSWFTDSQGHIIFSEQRLLDVNGDGALDLVAASSQIYFDSILSHLGMLNDGTGHFQSWIPQGTNGALTSNDLLAGAKEQTFYYPFVFPLKNTSLPSFVLEDIFSSTVQVGNPPTTETSIVHLSAFQPTSTVTPTPAPTPNSATIQFGKGSYTVSEYAVTATIPVSRAKNSVGPVSVHYATADGSALAGRDYSQLSSKLTFASGETQKNITVSILLDPMASGTRTFTIALSAPTANASLGTPSTTTVTISANGSCSYSINPSQDVAEAEGFFGGAITVTAGSSCSWTAVSNAPSWILIRKGWSGTGNGEVQYAILPNNGPSGRSGTITVAGHTFTVTQGPGSVGNVSTRLPVGQDDNVLIEGFIVQGPQGSLKKILVRAIGPSLEGFGIADALANPTLEIHDQSGTTVAANNDWKNTQVGGLITGNQFGDISNSGLPPSDDLEAAIIANLAPGSYTAIVRGLGNTTGTGVVDAYDLSGSSPARLANIATRGLIQAGDKLMIAGFIIQNAPVKAVLRAIGPSLTAFGINNALPDTTLQLRDQNGAIVKENDDWKSDSQQAQELQSLGLQPSNDLEAALIATIPPGQYTAQVRGKPEGTGIGVVQVYFLQ